MTEKYITYRWNGRTFDVPESQSAEMEKNYPDATIEMRMGDRSFDVPLAHKQEALDKYGSDISFSFDRETEVKPEPKQDAKPVETEEQQPSFAPAEDEGAVTEFLKTHPEFSVEKVDAPTLSPGRPDCIPDPAPGIEHTFRLWPHKLRGEGHFAAVLRKLGDEEREEPRPVAGQKLPKEWSDFAKELGITLPEGEAITFGQSLYWVPKGMPDLTGLKVERPGLELGIAKKGRFEPAHALALWLRDCRCVQDYSADSNHIAAYLHGDVVPSTQKGWCLVTVDGYSIGWGKGDGNVLKNHYPKGLRLK